MPLPIRPRSGLRAVAARLRADDGFSLIEMLVVMVIFLIVMSAASVAFEGTEHTEQRDQAYAAEVQSAQSAIGRLIHDLREATSFPSAVQPGILEFQMPINGVSYNVAYNCTIPDPTRGSPYTDCARTQAQAPSTPPVPGTSWTPGPDDIQHVWNNPANTRDLSAGNDYTAFCTATGSGQSGSVFYVQNPNTPNPDTNPPSCDQTYELLVASDPDYVQVRAEVSAGGDLKTGGLTHMIVLQAGTYLPNIDQGA